MAYDSPNEAEEAATLLALARQTHEAHVAAAKAKAEAIIGRAEEEAGVILTNAREEYKWLEEKIAKHRDFEARYRGAISTYLQDLLDEINQDDEFVAPATLSPVVEEAPEVEEDSAFAVEEEPSYPEPTYEAAPVYEEEPQAEPTYEEPAVAEPVDEFVYSAPVVEEPQVHEEPVYEEPVQEEAPVEDSREADEFTYDTPVIEEEPELVPTFAEGDAPIPGYSDEQQDYPEDAEDLPPVPESLDSYGSASEDIAALDNELQDHGPEDDEEIENFDSLLAGEPKPATGAVTAQQPAFDDSEKDGDESDKGVRSFFGFKKS